jgi:hypothetical protein
VRHAWWLGRLLQVRRWVLQALPELLSQELLAQEPLPLALSSPEPSLASAQA